MQKKRLDNQDDKTKAMLNHSNESRNSETGYLNRGNPASINAKARAIRNNSNR
ncbi:hypothetical protein [Clostridium fermenticellae]|uniref:hypothetical protein n=1 Tax=Clostridium fermenticellae TaxID=2068654 RepID=UPI0013C410AD|nr:hypothetical protein [Clostridium fermenticellae]